MTEEARDESQSSTPITTGALLALAAVAALALLARSIAAPYVFSDPDSLVFYVGDPYFHLYRALAGLEVFPAFLSFDLYTNFPHGTVIPAAPFFDLLIAAVTRALSGDAATLERVAAWLPPAFGAATTVPVFVIGRAVGGPGVGLGAALVYALLPAGVGVSMIGYADHHALVGLLGATLLASEIRLLQAPRGRLSAFAVLAIARAVLVLTWSGSLLYLALGDVVFVIIAVAIARRDLLFGVSLGAFASAALIAPAVVAAAIPLGGPFSAVELSYLHVLVVAGLSVWAALLAALQRRAAAATATPARRLAEAAGVGAALAGVALVASGAGAELVEAMSFVGKADGWGAAVLEQAPLFDSSGGLPPGLSEFGGFLLLVPFAPWVAWGTLRNRVATPVVVLLVTWSAVLGTLATLQVRFANDLAAVAAVLVALLAKSLADWLTARWGVASRGSVWLAGLAAALLLLPTAPLFYAPFATLARVSVSPPHPAFDPTLATLHGSALRFARTIEQTTPETSGFLRSDVVPEYGLLADPNLGHLLQYAARRPAATNNFGPYIGRQNVDAVERFFASRNEREALQIARSLGCRYIVTNVGRSDDPRDTRNRLHLADGLATRRGPSFAHFRLVTEGPGGGIPFATLYRSIRPEDWGVPYKLFEVVEGALLEVEAAPGQRVTAAVDVRTPLGRRFSWQTSARGDDEGWARIRVPYATRTSLPTRTSGRYRVRVGETVHRVAVTDRDVETGQTVQVSRDHVAEPANRAPGP